MAGVVEWPGEGGGGEGALLTVCAVTPTAPAVPSPPTTPPPAQTSTPSTTETQSGGLEGSGESSHSQCLSVAQTYCIFSAAEINQNIAFFT